MLWPELRKLGEFGVTGRAGRLASMRRSQGDGVLGNDRPRASLLTRIHDVVPVFDGQNLLSPVGLLRDPQ